MKLFWIKVLKSYFNLIPCGYSNSHFLLPAYLPSLSLSLTHIHTHTHTYSLSLTHTHIHSLLSLSHTHLVSLSSFFFLYHYLAFSVILLYLSLFVDYYFFTFLLPPPCFLSHQTGIHGKIPRENARGDA